MAVKHQQITDEYAIYNGDSCEVLPTFPEASIHLSVYSPPFAGMYHYSSSERDLSNCASYEEFFRHYDFIVEELFRITKPGRMTVVHCMDVPRSNTGRDSYIDFPGDIIRQHERIGWDLASPRICIWKEPLAVRNRTMTKALAHKTIVDDSTSCTVAGADYLLVFRKPGINEAPVTHPVGLLSYAGEREIPKELLRYKGWTGKQTENRFSHWIWRQYASCIWDDIRGNTGTRRVPGVLPYREARQDEDEKHLHPLQLDVIERAVTLWSNEGETVLTPFMGVGSEVYRSVMSRRRGVGIELKESYYRQAIKNIEYGLAHRDDDQEQLGMFADEPETEQDEADRWGRTIGELDQLSEAALRGAE